MASMYRALSAIRLRSLSSPHVPDLDLSHLVGARPKPRQNALKRWRFARECPTASNKSAGQPTGVLVTAFSVGGHLWDLRS
jgi:hypothetical protein